MSATLFLPDSVTAQAKPSQVIRGKRITPWGEAHSPGQQAAHDYPRVRKDYSGGRNRHVGYEHKRTGEKFQKRHEEDARYKRRSVT